ncbi:hypothetical protein MMC17_004514 [Xylographa soralifera]|nr:hypothetical protein [Xylographa soralifera]
MAATTLETLLSSLTTSLNSATASLPEASDIAPPSDGISLLDTKNELLLSYLQNLVFLIVLKLRDVSNSSGEHGNQGNSVGESDSIRDEVVKKLVELRVYLEKGAKPLEGRLRYQIDKVVRAAEDEDAKEAASAMLKSQNTNGAAAGARTINGHHSNGGRKDDVSDDSDVSHSDEEEDAQPATTVDPLAYRPNPSALTLPSRPEARTSTSRSDGIYRPPRITPTSLPTTTPRNTTTSKRPSKSATLDEFVATELSTAPIAEPSIGSTIIDRGRRSKSAKEREAEKERRGYEESNYLRLPTEGKKGKGRGRKDGMGYGGEEWRGLGEGAERVVGLTRKGRGGSVLERSRKRPRDDGGGGGEVRMGERFEKRRKAKIQQPDSDVQTDTVLVIHLRDIRLTNRTMMEENTVSEPATMKTKTIKESTPRLVVTDIPAPHFASLIASETVVLVVGPKRKRFSAHKDLLCYIVPYFEKAFNGAFAEATDGTIYFAEADPAARELFIGWLYRGRPSLTLAGNDFAPFLRLCVLADMWCLPDLQNSIIDIIFNWFDSKDPEKRLETLKSMVKGCWDDIKEIQAPTAAILFITIDLSKHPSIDHDDVYVLIDLNDDFAISLSKFHIWVSKRYGIVTLTRTVIEKHCHI